MQVHIKFLTVINFTTRCAEGCYRSAAANVSGLCAVAPSRTENRFVGQSARCAGHRALPASPRVAYRYQLGLALLRRPLSVCKACSAGFPACGFRELSSSVALLHLRELGTGSPQNPQTRMSALQHDTVIKFLTVRNDNSFAQSMLQNSPPCN